jgi:fucose permease
MVIPKVILVVAVSLMKSGKSDTLVRNTSEKSYTFLSAIRDKDVWHFGVTLGFMVALEVATVNWGALYLQDVYSLDPLTDGASFVSLFFVFFTISRLLSGFAIEKIGYRLSLLISAASSTAIFTLGFGLGETGIWILPATGFFLGIMWPTLIAVAMKHFGKNAPLSTGAIIAMAGAVNSFLQFIIGLTGRYAGNAWGYRSCALYAALLVLLVLSIMRKPPRISTSPESASLK